MPGKLARAAQQNTPGEEPRGAPSRAPDTAARPILTLTSIQSNFCLYIKQPVPETLHLQANLVQRRLRRVRWLVQDRV